MKRWKSCGLLAAGTALSLALSACGSMAGTEHGGSGQEEAPLQVLGLSAGQKMEDYEYFWSTLRDSYPCWGILEREGVDVDAIYQEYKELLEESDSDTVFYSALYSALWRLGRNGHLWIIEPEDYQEMMAQPQADRPTDRDSWYRLLDDPATAEGYTRLAEMMQAAYEEGETDGTETEGESADNVTALFLPGEKTAYLKIASFGADMETDRPVLDAFYRELAGYTDLVIDLTENSGGSEWYWQDLVVAPLIDEPLQCVNYALTRMSGNNRPYLEEVFTPEELRPIDELPDLPRLQEADRSLATHFVRSTLSVEPAAARAPFHGRVWVLVGQWVYSASESFAVFCQQTGFATLVGNQTGGDGIGALDPVFLQLPNSRILIQFTAMFGLNPDGGSNEEYGTTPDLISQNGELPLITALRAVQQAQKKG